MSRSLSRLQALLLGVAVCGAVGLGVLGLFAVGDRQGLWGKHFQVQAGFHQIHGVEVGTRVRLQGMEVGEVIEVQPPSAPGADVVLVLRVQSRFQPLVRADASAQIVSEGMIGGKVVEIDPGRSPEPVAADARIATRPTTDLTHVLSRADEVLQGIRDGEGTLGRLARDPEAFEALVALAKQSNQTMVSFQQDADAIKRLPVIRSYVTDPHALLVRPNCERNRRWFREADLFEPGRAVLTAQGKERLGELAPWVNGLKHTGSEVVVAAYADPQRVASAPAQTLTQQQSEAVCTYLREQHGAHKMGWFSSRKVTPLGLGTNPPPVPEKETLPPARVEVLVFVPQ